MSLLMPHGFRDIILVACALICAVAAIYIVYNIEIFKHRYELQIMDQPISNSRLQQRELLMDPGGLSSAFYAACRGRGSTRQRDYHHPSRPAGLSQPLQDAHVIRDRGAAMLK